MSDNISDLPILKGNLVDLFKKIYIYWHGCCYDEKLYETHVFALKTRSKFRVGRTRNKLVVSYFVSRRCWPGLQGWLDLSRF